MVEIEVDYIGAVIMIAWVFSLIMLLVYGISFLRTKWGKGQQDEIDPDAPITLDAEWMAFIDGPSFIPPCEAEEEQPQTPEEKETSSPLG